MVAAPPSAPAAAPPAPGRPPRRRRGLRRGGYAPLLFISAAVVLFVLFFLWPGALGVIYSFTDYRGYGSLNFVGVDNYAKLAGDSRFYGALTRTLLYTALAVPAHFVAALGIAVLLTSTQAVGKNAARVVFFLPWLISPIVTGVVWRWVFGENFGFVNVMLQALGGPALNWESDGTLALIVILVAGTWTGTAFNMLLFIAALRNIPKSYLEAAELDGANSWQRFRRITLPLLGPTSFMVVLLTTIGSMKEFALIQALNDGGPGTANTLMVQYIYRTGFERNNIGYASAASIVLMVILVVIALVQLRFDRRSALS
ncbi:carbohydrate ABC transporter permease [Pseudonocardia sp. CA-107938]|uniref:carbohydrate ABC transporter permease n=1 Tax=Pseudonocardia sp. CA-107938 TaxID=3240021 RepID=UPI003D8AE6DA